MTNLWMTLTLAGLVAIGAVAVDIAFVRVARAQLRSSLEAAALSGATELDGTAEGIATAEARVLEYAEYNRVLRKGVQVDPNNVEAGTWDQEARSFSVWSPGDDPRQVNAVRVSEAVPLGKGEFGVEASAIALRPRGAGPQDTR